MHLGSVRSCCPAPCLSLLVCFNHTVAPDSDSIRDVSQKMNGSEAPWGRSHFPRERSEAAYKNFHISACFHRPYQCFIYISKSYKPRWIDCRIKHLQRFSPQSITLSPQTITPGIG